VPVKLQITAIFEGAYKFLFANALAIIGIAWLPYVVAIVVSGLAVLGAIPLQWWQGDFSQMTEDAVWLMVPKFVALSVVFVFVWIVTASMVTVGIQRRALGLSQGPVFAYFSLAAPVWRLIGANFLMFFAITGIGIGLTLACSLVIAGANAVLSQGLTVLIGVLLGIAGYCAFIYIAVRWSFFIAPVVVAEGRIGLARAWHLGHGNFWRILAIAIVVYLPVSFAGGLVTQVVIGLFGGPIDLNNFPDHPTGTQVAEALHQLFTAILPAVGISMLLQMIAMAGVSNGAQALAYRQMTTPQPEGH
jgi:hypothetical protein